MTQGMHRSLRVNHRAAFGPGKQFLHTAFTILPAGRTFKDPFYGFVYFQVNFQEMPCLFRKERTSVLVAFPGSDEQSVLFRLQIGYTKKTCRRQYRAGR